MAKSSAVEDALAKLHALAKEPSGSALQEIRKYLASKTNLIAARAAKIAKEKRLTELTADLNAAFDRFMTNPTSTDKGCAAKLAIADVLYELGSGSSELFLRGVHHVQMEPTIGGQVDTAAELRGTSALGLVRVGYRDVLTELADLLMDREMQARMLAARALAYCGQPAGALLLRMKILAGDREVDVLAECFSALVKLAPATGILFVARFLDAPGMGIPEAAALALGETHQPAAFDLLRQAYAKQFDEETRRAFLLAIAMLRRPEAIDFLLSRLTESKRDATDVLDALKLYRNDQAVRARTATAVSQHNDHALQRRFEKEFGV